MCAGEELMHSEKSHKHWPEQNPEQFVERTTNYADRRVFQYTIGEERTRARFLQLAIDTYNFLHTLPSHQPDGFHPGYGFWPDHMPDNLSMDRMRQHAPSLLAQWENWKREYSEIRARNPLLDL